MSRRSVKYEITPDLWERRDWREHWASEQHQPLNATLPTAPTHTLNAGFSLRGKPRGGERSRQVDLLLEELGIPRRRARVERTTSSHPEPSHDGRFLRREAAGRSFKCGDGARRKPAWLSQARVSF
jgi:hypothetical protein